MSSRDDPWSIAGTFPDPGVGPRPRIELALVTALTAPSQGNGQPWRWFVGGEVIELYLDRTRLDPVLDPEGQAARVACGAGLGALRVALRALGLGEETVLLPGGHPDLLARVSVAGAVQATPEEQWLYQASPKRRTFGGVMAARGVSRSMLRRLPSLVGEASCRLVEALPDRQALGAHVEAVLGAEDLEVARARKGAGERATFELEDGSEARGDAIAAGSPVFAAVSTPGDAPDDWLRAGQALMRVLLRARVDHAWASFFHAALRTAALRAALGRQLGPGEIPQALLRLGPGADLAPSPRRSLADVLLATRP